MVLVGLMLWRLDYFMLQHTIVDIATFQLAVNWVKIEALDLMQRGMADDVAFIPGGAQPHATPVSPTAEAISVAQRASRLEAEQAAYAEYDPTASGSAGPAPATHEVALAPAAADSASYSAAVSENAVAGSAVPEQQSADAEMPSAADSASCSAAVSETAAGGGSVSSAALATLLVPAASAPVAPKSASSGAWSGWADGLSAAADSASCPAAVSDIAAVGGALAEPETVQEVIQTTDALANLIQSLGLSHEHYKLDDEPALKDLLLNIDVPSMSHDKKMACPAEQFAEAQRGKMLSIVNEHGQLHPCTPDCSEFLTFAHTLEELSEAYRQWGDWAWRFTLCLLQQKRDLKLLRQVNACPYLPTNLRIRIYAWAVDFYGIHQSNIMSAHAVEGFGARASLAAALYATGSDYVAESLAVPYPPKPVVQSSLVAPGCTCTVLFVLAGDSLWMQQVGPARNKRLEYPLDHPKLAELNRSMVICRGGGTIADQTFAMKKALFLLGHGKRPDHPDLEGMLVNNVQVPEEQIDREQLPSKLSEPTRFYARFAFNELVDERGKVVKLGKAYFGEVLPRFAKYWLRFGPGELMAVIDGQLWGLSGRQLDLWTSQCSLVVNMLRSPGVNVVVQDARYHMLAQVMGAKEGAWHYPKTQAGDALLIADLRLQAQRLSLMLSREQKDHAAWRNCFDNVDVGWSLRVDGSVPAGTNFAVQGTETPPLQRCKRAGMRWLRDGKRAGTAAQWVEAAAAEQGCDMAEIDLESISGQLHRWAIDVRSIVRSTVHRAGAGRHARAQLHRPHAQG